MLIIFGGLPGTGKSTISKRLAEKLHAVYLRIDSFEQGIRNSYAKYGDLSQKVTAERYLAAYAVAKDNLEIGHTVIADSVNPIELTRNAWRQVATDANNLYLEVEIICSDKIQHRNRIETRGTTIDNLILPTWQDVTQREYEPWDNVKLVIDTSIDTVDKAVKKILCVVEDIKE